MVNFDLNQALIFAKNLAIQSGTIILDNFSLSFESKIKDDLTPVTIIDEKINRLVIEEVSKVYPGHQVLGEEENKIINSDYSWVCDPIDGTIPFTMGIPVSVFGLALLYQGTPIIGVVYDAYTKRLYSAAKNSGAFMNDKAIRVNQLELTSKARINLDWWPQAEYAIYEPVIKLAKTSGAYVFSPGSVIQAGACLARGQFTASIFAGSTGKFVDIAPLKILIEEAGGKVTDLFGNEQRYDKDIRGALMTNGIVHEQFLEALAEVKKN